MSRRRAFLSKAVVGLGTLALMVASGGAAANHIQGWTHDHSSRGIPYRPHGGSDLRRVFGAPCNSRFNDARTWFPSARARNQGGYVYYHPYLARNVGHNIRTHINFAHRDRAVDYGVYGASCRQMRGGTKWSTHAFGAAIDTNTKRNPQGQGHWNGRGSDGVNYGKYIPGVWKGRNPGHFFRWGLHFPTPDPHHFQYVSGY